MTTLAVSESADEAIAASKSSDKLGEVGVILNVRPEKLKKNRQVAAPAPAKKTAKKSSKGAK